MQALFTDSVSYGFSHPLAGLDHLLAMFAVGLLSVQVGSYGLGLYSGCICSVFDHWRCSGDAGTDHSADGRTGILFSVIALGVLHCPATSVCSMGGAGCVVAVFGIIHGYPHGTEIPVVANAFQYIGRFLACFGHDASDWRGHWHHLRCLPQPAPYSGSNGRRTGRCGLWSCW